VSAACGLRLRPVVYRLVSPRQQRLRRGKARRSFRSRQVHARPHVPCEPIHVDRHRIDRLLEDIEAALEGGPVSFPLSLNPVELAAGRELGDAESHRRREYHEHREDQKEFFAIH